MRKLFALCLALAVTAAHAQFNSGQVLSAAGLNAALAAPTITGGTIDNAPIGTSTASTGKFTTLTTTGRLGLGTVALDQKLVISSGSDATGSGDGIAFYGTSANKQAGILSFNNGNYSGDLRFYVSNASIPTTSLSERMRLSTTGLLLLGATSDGGSGALLQVAGTANVSNNVVVGSTSSVSQGSRLSIFGGGLQTGFGGLGMSYGLTAGRATSGNTSSTTGIIELYPDTSVLELASGLTSGTQIALTGNTAAVAPQTFRVFTGNAERLRVDGSGNALVQTVGAGLRVKEGANAKQLLSGSMTAGSITIANTSVTANSRIICTRQPGGANPGAAMVTAISAGVSFTVTSTNAADTGPVACQIFEPA